MNKTENIKINKINSVYDGDTFRGKVEALPDWVGDNMAFRIHGIDTPEYGWRAKCKAEKELGQKAKEFTFKMLTEAKHVYIDIIDFDKYGGRYLVDVRCDALDLATELIVAGLAREYDGGKKEGWC